MEIVSARKRKPIDRATPEDFVHFTLPVLQNKTSLVVLLGRALRSEPCPSPTSHMYVFHNIYNDIWLFHKKTHALFMFDHFFLHRLFGAPSIWPNTVYLAGLPSIWRSLPSIWQDLTAE
jgi:hypothetical protein